MSTWVSFGDSTEAGGTIALDTLTCSTCRLPPGLKLTLAVEHVQHRISNIGNDLLQQTTVVGMAL